MRPAAPDVVAAVADALRDRPRAQAVSGAQLADIVAAVLERRIHPRRCGEAVEALIDSGLPICSTAAAGYWWASSVEEIDDSLREVERRARRMLTRRRALRQRRAELLGQQRAHGMEHVSAPIARVMAALAAKVEG